MKPLNDLERQARELAALAREIQNHSIRSVNEVIRLNRFIQQNYGESHDIH